MDVCLLCVSCVVRERCASGLSLVQRNPTERGVSECDRETSVKVKSWDTDFIRYRPFSASVPSKV